MGVKEGLKQGHEFDNMPGTGDNVLEHPVTPSPPVPKKKHINHNSPNQACSCCHHFQDTAGASIHPGSTGAGAPTTRRKATTTAPISARSSRRVIRARLTASRIIPAKCMAHQDSHQDIKCALKKEHQIQGCAHQACAHCYISSRHASDVSLI